MSIVNIIEKLDRIDWDFPRTGNFSESIHRIHWFPGNFIAQIPSALIQILSKPGDLVLDPFSGSATTAVEAQKLGRRSIVSDRLSPSIMIAEAKLALMQGALSRETRRAILARLTFEHACHSDRYGHLGEGSDLALNDWFSPYTLSQLRYLWALIEEQAPLDRKVLSAIFSDVLFDCAAPGTPHTKSGKRRRHHWGWIADNVRPKSFADHKAANLFSQHLQIIDSLEPIAPSIGSFILQQDARQLALSNTSVDLVVTSPPYVGMIDYARANRLLYSWMNWPLIAERTDEIGARYRRDRRHAVSEYLSEMQLAGTEIHRVLKPGGFCAIVIGASSKFPTATETALESLSALMPMVWGPKARAPSRRRVSDRSAREPLEFVCVFRKS